MKKFLPKLLILIVIFMLVKITFAQDPSLARVDVNENLLQEEGAAANTLQPEDGQLIPDKNLKVAGKMVSRSSHMLNWVLSQYQWSNLAESNANNPFSTAWVFLRNIVYALAGLTILVAAFILIVTRGKSITAQQFIPRFILTVVLVTLSFSIIQFLYQITDLIQGFLLKKADSSFISDQDLLNVGFDYSRDFGYRRAGLEYEDSVLVTTWFSRFIAATYFAMFGVLILRKVILWFFLIASPILPLLFNLPIVSGSAKFWLGEFARWLLYGPLFALFLAGLVTVWSVGLPVKLDNASEKIYPTATDILIAGPGIDPRVDNLNSPASVIVFILAILMLWAVIILPFVLLKIVLSYVYSFSFTESNIIKYLYLRGRQEATTNIAKTKEDGEIKHGQ